MYHEKHTKRQVKDNFKKDAFISDVCHRCLCVISDNCEHNVDNPTHPTSLPFFPGCGYGYSIEILAGLVSWVVCIIHASDNQNQGANRLCDFLDVWT